MKYVDRGFGTAEVPPALQQVTAMCALGCGSGWVMEFVQILVCVAEAVAETKVR